MKAAHLFFLAMWPMWLLSCSMQEQKQPQRIVTPASGDLPNYITKLFPPSDGSVTLEDYTSRKTSSLPCSLSCPIVSIEIHPGGFDSLASSISFPERIFLEIDGMLVENDSMEFIELAKAFTRSGLNEDGEWITEFVESSFFQISWDTDLEIGHHVAVIWITMDSGGELAYRWEFVITE